MDALGDASAVLRLLRTRLASPGASAAPRPAPAPRPAGARLPSPLPQPRPERPCGQRDSTICPDRVFEEPSQTGVTPRKPLGFPRRSRPPRRTRPAPAEQRVPRARGPLRGGDETLGAGQTPPPARLSAAYLVIVEPRLQNLMQLPRQRVVGLRRGPTCPIAEAVGRPGRRRRDHLPAARGHVAGVRP